MSIEVVTLYVDYRSPYSYLAKDSAYQLEQDFNVHVDWLPYRTDFEGVYGTVDQRDERAWRKVRYLYMDVRRIANQRGLIVRGTRKIYDPSLASMGMLYAKKSGVLRPYHDSLLARFWSHEAEIDIQADVEAALEFAGASVRGFREYQETTGPTELETAYREAESSGIFGAPTFVFRGELFWGTDRVDMLRDRLAAAGLRR